MNAKEIGVKAIEAMDNRASERDVGTERSMFRTVQTFNHMRDKTLSEEDGWWFMVCLKAARSFAGELQIDDYVDGSAYVMLAGECASKMNEADQRQRSPQDTEEYRKRHPHVPESYIISTSKNFEVKA